MLKCPAATLGRGRAKRVFLARLSHSTTRLRVPLSRDFSFALLDSVRFHLKLYGMTRPMASYSVGMLRRVLEGTCPRNGTRSGGAQLVIRGSSSRFVMTLHLPAGLIARARLQALLPSRPPAGVQVTLKAGKRGPVLTLAASLAESV